MWTPVMFITSILATLPLSSWCRLIRSRQFVSLDVILVQTSISLKKITQCSLFTLHCTRHSTVTYKYGLSVNNKKHILELYIGNLSGKCCDGDDWLKHLLVSHCLRPLLVAAHFTFPKNHTSDVICHSLTDVHSSRVLHITHSEIS